MIAIINYSGNVKASKTKSSKIITPQNTFTTNTKTQRPVGLLRKTRRSAL